MSGEGFGLIWSVHALAFGSTEYPDQNSSQSKQSYHWQLAAFTTT